VGEVDCFYLVIDELGGDVVGESVFAKDLNKLQKLF